jgi:arylsulfatase A-like enzyme
MTRKDFLTLLSGAGGILLGGKARAIPAPAVARPNILLVMDDQHRPGWLGRLGRVPVRTPHLDRLAGKGIHFTNTYCAAPVCGPSRACLALGVEYDACGVPNHQAGMDAARPTYYQLLRASGYHVAGCGKFDLAKHSKSWGLDGKRHMAAWGFDDGFDSAGKWDAVAAGTTRPKDPYMAFLHERGLAAAHAKDFHRRGKYKGTGPTPLPDDAYNDNWIGRHALSLLQKMPRDRP